LRDTRKPPPLIGYSRISKADGWRALDLQRDVLLAAGVGEAFAEDSPRAVKLRQPSHWLSMNTNEA